MTRELWGEFSLEDSTIISFDASVYESRCGSVEGTFCLMNFANGKSVKVKPGFSIQIDNIDVIGQEEDGGIQLSGSGGGAFTFFDEKSQTFAGFLCLEYLLPGPLRPSLKVLFGSRVIRQDLQSLANSKFIYFLLGPYNWHRTVETYAIQDMMSLL
jgi:hypothetical protein